MDPTDMAIADLPALLSSTRTGVEVVIGALDRQHGGKPGALSAASALMTVAPQIAKRLANLMGDDADQYARVMRGAAVYVRTSWTDDATAAPSVANVRAVVEYIEGKESAATSDTIGNYLRRDGDEAKAGDGGQADDGDAQSPTTSPS